VNEDEGQDPLKGFRAKRKKSIILINSCANVDSLSVENGV
jgi:hypothetical protein